jgi:hypothetical protein
MKKESHMWKEHLLRWHFFMLKYNDRLLNKLERKTKRINTKRNQGNKDKWTIAKFYDVSLFVCFFKTWYSVRTYWFGRHYFHRLLLVGSSFKVWTLFCMIDVTQKLTLRGFKLETLRRVHSKILNFRSGRQAQKRKWSLESHYPCFHTKIV